ncbi:hypothetical protein Ssi03_67950 [Sphaerisporangium siamense]|nr:hypothetical protein Ssi03_67950 [Sphaerisporangium siamense]
MPVFRAPIALPPGVTCLVVVVIPMLSFVMVRSWRGGGRASSMERSDLGQPIAHEPGVLSAGEGLAPAHPAAGHVKTDEPPGQVDRMTSRLRRGGARREVA